MGTAYQIESAPLTVLPAYKVPQHFSLLKMGANGKGCFIGTPRDEIVLVTHKDIKNGN